MDRGLDLLGSALDKRKQRNSRRSAPTALSSAGVSPSAGDPTCLAVPALASHPLSEARALLLAASARLLSAILAHYLPTAAGPLTPDLFQVSDRPNLLIHSDNEFLIHTII